MEMDFQYWIIPRIKYRFT